MMLIKRDNTIDKISALEYFFKIGVASFKPEIIFFRILELTHFKNEPIYFYEHNKATSVRRPKVKMLLGAPSIKLEENLK